MKYVNHLWRSCVFLCALCTFHATQAQVTQAEYFFDTDPGFGQATPISVTAGADLSLSFSPSVAALSSGLHRLYVRSLAATGQWSNTSQRLFYKEAVVTGSLQYIIKAEYFFNEDPGFGNAYPYPPFIPGQDLTLPAAGFIPTLPTGLHRFFSRSLDTNGVWSMTTQQLIYKEAIVSNPLVNVIKAEYFFDTDPGFNNGTDFPLTAGQDITLNITAPVGALSNGFHRLYIRSLDANGKWSVTSQQLFYKEAVVNNPLVNIVKAEYFFDTDPGFNNGTDFPLTAGQDITLNITAPVGALSNGLHRMYVRTLDANGKWSVTSQQLFYKEAVVNNPLVNIVKAEYFFDTDPGFNNATDMPLAAGQDITVNVTAPVGALSDGLHRLYVRTLDANGKWSVTSQQLFYKEAVISNPLVNIVKAEYFFDTDPGFNNATDMPLAAGQDITVNVTAPVGALSNGLHRLYVRTLDANGKWSISSQQLFYKEAVVNNPLVNIVKAEYYFDTDPGFNNGNSMALTAGQDIVLNVSASINALPAGIHRLFTRTLDANGKWSVTSQQMFYKETLVTSNNSPMAALEYAWDTDPGFGLATRVTFPANSGELTSHTFAVTTPYQLSNGKHNLYVRVVDGDDWSLTTVKMVDFTGIVLPVQLLEFTAIARTASVDVKWTTTNEINNDHFEVERSTDGVNFIKIGNVAAKGGAGLHTDYLFPDLTPVTGMNYYRLKQVDIGGAYKHSAVVAIRFDAAARSVALFPNPATDYFMLKTDKKIKTLILADMNGKQLQQWPVAAQQRYALKAIAKGMYVLTILTESGERISKTLMVN